MVEQAQNAASYTEAEFSAATRNCPYCDSVLRLMTTQIIAFTAGRLKGLTPAAEPCGKINPKEAAYCSECGNRVYRIRQGFALASAKFKEFWR